LLVAFIFLKGNSSLVAIRTLTAGTLFAAAALDPATVSA
jgi:hypothetical protein